MKIIHLVVDDKFLDAAIREFEAVAPGRHEYLLLGGGGPTLTPTRYLRSPLVQRVSVAQWQQRVGADDVAAVVFHSLLPGHLPLLRALPAGPTVVWLGWGFDYYGLLADAFPQGLVQPGTAALLAGLRPRVLRNAPGTLATSELSVARPCAKPGAAERAALARVDIFSPVLDVEHALVQQHQPWLRAAYRPWNYLTLEDDLQLDTPPPAEPGVDLLVGNSATPSNNHVEAFEHLRRCVDLAGRRVVVPLSYGDTAYADAIERLGRQQFGSAFVPLRHFMPREQYLQLLDGCGVLVMNHLRQQALGNVVIAGLRGARLFLNFGNPMARWLHRQGVQVDDIRRLDTTPLPPAQRVHNRAAITAFTSRQHRRAQTQRLVEELLASSKRTAAPLAA